MALHFKPPQAVLAAKAWLQDHGFEEGPPPLAITWLKAQGIGMVVLVGLKIFPICNPYLGFAIAATTYLTEQVARYFFQQLFDQNHPFLEYCYALTLSTFCLHNFIHLALPAMENLLQFDLNYILLRNALTVTYIIGEALFQRYRPQAS